MDIELNFAFRLQCEEIGPDAVLALGELHPCLLKVYFFVQRRRNVVVLLVGLSKAGPIKNRPVFPHNITVETISLR